MRVILMILVLYGGVFGSGCLADTYPVTGTVFGGGYGIRGARVVAYRASDGYSRSALTNAFGNYVLKIQDCGSYRIWAVARGWSFSDVMLGLPRDQFADGAIIDFVAF